MLTRFCRFSLRYFPAHGVAAPAGNGAQAEAVRSALNKTNPEFLGMVLPPSGGVGSTRQREGDCRHGFCLVRRRRRRHYIRVKGLGEQPHPQNGDEQCEKHGEKAAVRVNLP